MKITQKYATLRYIFLIFLREEMTLDELTVGNSAIVQSIDCPDKILRKHFLDMGLTPGVTVSLIKTAPLGNPVEIKVRGYELTIRKEEAKKISVATLENSERSEKNYKELPFVEHPKIGETDPDETLDLNNSLIFGDIDLALVGNPNAGKTTLFNKLTGRHRRVGNFPGVTVEGINAKIKDHPDMSLTDLPGIYSLSPYSNEEIVTRNFILQKKPHAIINIVDASNIERNLYLTLQLIELDTPMVIALNMMDEVMKSGGHIDINAFEAALGVPVVPISALRKEGLEELLEHAENVARRRRKPRKLEWGDHIDVEQKPVASCINSIAHLIEDSALSPQIPTRFAAAKIAEGDSVMRDSLSLDESKKEVCDSLIKEMETSRELDREAAVADMRFSFIENLCRNFVQKPKEALSRRVSTRIDKILTGKYTAFPAFIAVMASIFYMTFGSIGASLSDFLNSQIEKFSDFINAGLTDYGLNPAIHSLITDGALAGVGSVLSFLPIIILLFFFLSLLEDSGYMARVAFIMDKILRKIGLSGSSFVPMLMGFGCSVPAIMATRILPSERDRKMTILLIPFMSCSAKLPIYALFTSAFFKESQALVMVSLYLIGIILGMAFICALKLFAFKGEPVPFVMELPNYRMPDAQSMIRLVYFKVRNFVKFAFTIIFVVSIFVWFLQHFDSRLNFVTESTENLLAMVGNSFTPIFEPLGIADWRVSTAFLSGFLAKESVISTLSVLCGGIDALPAIFTKLTAFVFLIFSLLYTPCVAAIATVKKELGKRWAFGIILVQCVIAWVIAFVSYRIGLLFS